MYYTRRNALALYFDRDLSNVRWVIYLQTVDVAEILASLLDAGNHDLLGLTDPDTGIVNLLVGLVGALGVSNLSLEVIL